MFCSLLEYLWHWNGVVLVVVGAVVVDDTVMTVLIVVLGLRRRMLFGISVVWFSSLYITRIRFQPVVYSSIDFVVAAELAGM